MVEMWQLCFSPFVQTAAAVAAAVVVAAVAAVLVWSSSIEKERRLRRPNMNVSLKTEGVTGCEIRGT